MIDIVDELRILAAKLDEYGIEYALCGGMAMGVHGHLRTTIDIDMLVLPETLPQVLEVAGSLGTTWIWTFELLTFDGCLRLIPIPMTFCLWISFW